jgi:hypothetical protein
MKILLTVILVSCCCASFCQDSSSLRRIIGLDLYTGTQLLANYSDYDSSTGSVATSQSSILNLTMPSLILFEPVTLFGNMPAYFSAGIGYTPLLSNAKTVYADSTYTSTDVQKISGNAFNMSVGLLYRKQLRKAQFMCGPQLRYSYSKYNNLYRELVEVQKNIPNYPVKKRMLTGYGPAENKIAFSINAIGTLKLYKGLHAGFRFNIAVYSTITSGSFVQDVKNFENDIEKSSYRFERKYKSQLQLGNSFEPSVMLLWQF